MTDMMVLKAVADAADGWKSAVTVSKEDGFDLDNAIMSFEDDPSDSDFQEGFLLSLLHMKEMERHERSVGEFMSGESDRTDTEEFNDDESTC